MFEQIFHRRSWIKGLCGSGRSAVNLTADFIYYQMAAEQVLNQALREQNRRKEVTRNKRVSSLSVSSVRNFPAWDEAF